MNGVISVEFVKIATKFGRSSDKESSQGLSAQVCYWDGIKCVKRLCMFNRGERGPKAKTEPNRNR
ncbi:hypothetical protein OSB04_006828 [Centaurea solstitialis]|uniref:Uncharacterized protein n=1 Tax=Centaurea solstitialis TaxID=347529 RepID=A0AA38U391_9ASTR|nr:hypothetical protein OSB04_006828 [Centaurea solstitialis]